MQTFSDIINLWPDPAPVSLAGDLQEEPGTVRQWRNRDVLPPGKWLGVIRSASRRRIRGVSLYRLARIAAAQYLGRTRRTRRASRAGGGR